METRENDVKNNHYDDDDEQASKHLYLPLVKTHNNANIHKASGQATRKAKGHQCWLP